MINKVEVKTRAQAQIEAAKEKLQELESRFELEYASVFSISVLQEKIVTGRFITELTGLLEYIDKDIDTREKLERLSDDIAKRYLRDAFRAADQSFRKASQEFEESSNLELSKKLFQFFRYTCSEKVQDAMKVLQISGI